MASTNYGMDFGKGDAGSPTELFTSIGSIIKMTVPDIKTESKNTTNHQSSGKATSISSGLVELDDIVCVIDANHTNLAAIYDDILDKSIDNYKVTFADATIAPWILACFPTSIKFQDIDNDNPDQLRAEITYAIANFSALSVTTA